jgi:hypothetical protein
MIFWRKKFPKIIFLSATVIFISGVATSSIKASEIRQYQGGDLIKSLILTPAKTELQMEPGQQLTKEIRVINGTGQNLKIDVKVEDTEGSSNPEQTIVLMGDKQGHYSLKDWIKPEIASFDLKPREEMLFNIKISAPANAEPGGYYGAVVVSAVGAEDNNSVKFVSGLGSLFFLRIAGSVKESGFVSNFKVAAGLPARFQFVYQNQGNVYLTPYGYISVKNIFGREKGFMEIAPYFVMPNSTRAGEKIWQGNCFLSICRAELFLNRGYQNIVDKKELIFCTGRTEGIIVLVVVALLSILAAAIFLIFLRRKQND